MIRFDNHAFKGLDQSLKRLFDLLHSMGDGVSELISLLPATLESPNADVHAQAKAVDKTINNAELEVDSTVAAAINKFTIMGEDLRFVLATIKVAGTLERTADKIKNCAKRLSRIEQPLKPDTRNELAIAIKAIGEMVPLALAQLTDYSDKATQDLLQHGATIQKSYRTIIVQLHAHNAVAEDETHILLVAKNLDQAADMLVEIVKTCHYIHLGTKYEKAAS